MATKYLLVSAIVALQLMLTSAQAPDGVTFFGFNSSSFRQYDNLGAFVSSKSLYCGFMFPLDATLGGDGRIWFSADNYLKYVDPQTYECGKVAINASFIINAFASPSGRYIAFLQDGSIYRYDLRTKATELLLQKASANYPYFTFGFVGSNLVAVRPGLPFNLTVEFYSLNENDNLFFPLRAAITTNGPNDWPIQKLKAGPGGQVFGFYSSPYGWLSNLQGTTLTNIVFAPERVFDYLTAPWGLMYFVTSLQRLYTYNTTVDSVVAQYYSGPTGTTTLLAVLGAPTVSVTSDCQASVQFNTYHWTSKYTVQVQNPLTGLFEDDQVEVRPNAGSQNVQLTALCNGANMRVRVRLHGESWTDPIFSLPQTVNCTCQAPVPNVIPILECIEQIESGFVVHLGYNNAESYVAQLQVGPNNRFSDVDDRNQPTSFAVGRSNFYPDSAFKFSYSGNVTWFLSTYTLNFDTSDTSLLCPQNVSFVLSFTSITDVTQSDIDNIRDGIVNLLNITSSRVNVVNVTSTPVTKKRATNIVQITFEITAAQSGNELSAAESVRVIANLPTPTLTQIINGGDNSNGRTVQSVSTVASGTEQQGQDPNAPIAAPQSDSTTPTKNSTPKSTVSSAAVGAPTILLALLVTIAY